MNRADIMPWLMAWGGGTGLLLALLVAVSAFAEYRRLAARGYPKPLFLIGRRVRGILIGARGQAPGTLTGRTAWVSWDIRWLTSGETLAVVMAQSEALDLELEHPIEVAGQPGLRRVRFVPRNLQRAAYARAAVHGRLHPSLEGGVAITAVVVVYPDPRG